MAMVKPASCVPLMLEKISNYTEYTNKSVQQWSIANPSVYGPSAADHPGWIDATGFNENVQQSKADWTRFAVCHNSGGNILFADGHVAWFAWTDVQFMPSQLPWGNNSDINQPDKIVWCPLGPTGGKSVASSSGD